MELTFEEGLAALKELRSWYSDHSDLPKRNEATTRLHLINRLFFDVLGWPPENCTAEETYAGQYTDFSFRCDNQRLLVIEAKKEGIYFELPEDFQKGRLQISTLVDQYPEIGLAIKQAITYCKDRGTAYGGVSNGHQLIAFLGSRTDGVPPLDGQALVFGSFKFMEENFLTLWKHLSFAGIQNRNLSTVLLEQSGSRIPDKLSASIRNYPGFKIRNELQSNLQILGDLVISDVANVSNNEKDFLEHCYCESGAQSEYAVLTRSLLNARYSNLFSTTTGAPALEPARSQKGLSSNFVSQGIGERPVLLVGDVGVGKTIFIRNFLNVVAPDTVQKAIVFYVDLGSKPVSETDIPNFIFLEMAEQLEKDYQINIHRDGFVRGIYDLEIHKFRDGIYGPLQESNPTLFKEKEIAFLGDKIANRELFTKDALTHIYKAHEKQVILYMDNVDQRTDNFQQQAFLVATTIASTMPVAVFVTLRPETFAKSKLKGTLAAYHPKAFTIFPPRPDLVIQKRLSYAISIVETGRLGEHLKGVHIQSETLLEYLNVMSYSFNNNSDLKRFIENMCGGNIRVALDFIKEFIGSGHVDTVKIAIIQKRGEHYRIPLHEFFRAIVYGDHANYDPKTSPIVNVFDVSANDSKQHFLMPLILRLSLKVARINSQEGYVTADQIYNEMQNVGFLPEQIKYAINRLQEKKLLETNLKSTPDSALPPLFYRITSVGAYYETELIKTFPYLDAVVVDTPILIEEYRLKISDIEDLDGRLARAKSFLQYLDSQASICGKSEVAEYWPQVSLALKDQMQGIEVKRGKAGIMRERRIRDDRRRTI